MPSRLGRSRAGSGTGRAGSGTGRAGSCGHGRTDLEGAVQELCRAGRGQERAEHGPCHGGRASAGSPRPGSGRARTADALAEPRANRADRAVRARADRWGKPGHGANDPRRAHGEPESTGQPAPRMADTAAGPSTPMGPGHARGEPDRYRVGIGGGRVIIPLSGSPPQRRSTGKQQPGPPKLRRSGLSRHSHLTGHQGDKSLASESAWV